MIALHHIEQGAGQVEQDGDGWALRVTPASAVAYSNAMLTSYHTRRDFSFGAGARLELTAHAEGTLHGTAGFGFWNHPYGMGLRPPRAVWFFFSTPPNDMPLALGVPGHGFKATVFDAQRLPFYALLPFAPLGVLLMRVPLLYRALWPVGQWAIGVDECALDAALLRTPRRYAIDWGRDRVTFSMDGDTVFTTRRVPRGQLGFVAWVDNQYAIVTPQGRVGAGVVDGQDSQTLFVKHLTLTMR